jgi:hypothetical protein
VQFFKKSSMGKFWVGAKFAHERVGFQKSGIHLNIRLSDVKISNKG